MEELYDEAEILAHHYRWRRDDIFNLRTAERRYWLYMLHRRLEAERKAIEDAKNKNRGVDSFAQAEEQTEQQSKIIDTREIIRYDGRGRS